MKTTFCFIVAIASLMLAVLSPANAQGTFGNLAFESANIPPGTQISTMIPATNAFPKWSSTAPVYYDGLSTGGAIISIIDSNVGAGFQPLQGNYSVFLFGGPGGPTTLSQTGLVPVGTESLLVDLAGSGIPLLIVSLGGQTIQMVPVATSANYTQYGGDISAFAGLQAQLSFTEQPPVGVPPSVLELDNVLFSTSPVPEPGTMALLFTGALLLGVYRWRKSTP